MIIEEINSGSRKVKVELQADGQWSSDIKKVKEHLVVHLQ